MRSSAVLGGQQEVGFRIIPRYPVLRLWVPVLNAAPRIPLPKFRSTGVCCWAYKEMRSLTIYLLAQHEPGKRLSTGRVCSFRACFCELGVVWCHDVSSGY